MSSVQNMDLTGPHHALTIPEILLRILLKLSAKDLVSVALVRKEWTSIALDTKWRYHRINLRRVLERLKWYEDYEWYYYRHWDYDVTQERWDSFLHWGSKFTHLNLDTGVSGAYIRHVACLAERFGGGVPCPNLQVVETPRQQDESPWVSLSGAVKVLQRLCSTGDEMHTIRKVVIEGHPWRTVKDNVVHLTTMGRFLPALQELAMPAAMSAHILGFEYCTWVGLTTLREYYATSLARLTISMRVRLQDLETDDSIPSTPFQVLHALTFQHLEVDHEAFKPLAMRLAALCPNLRTLTIESFRHMNGQLRGSEEGSSKELEEAVFSRLRHLHGGSEKAE